MNDLMEELILQENEVADKKSGFYRSYDQIAALYGQELSGVFGSILRHYENLVKKRNEGRLKGKLLDGEFFYLWQLKHISMTDKPTVPALIIKYCEAGVKEWEGKNGIITDEQLQTAAKELEQNKKK